MVNESIVRERSTQKNKFWVHHVYIEKDTVSTSAGTTKSSKTAYTTYSANHTLTQTEIKVNQSQFRSYDKNKNATYISKNDIRFTLTKLGEITDADLIDLFGNSEEVFDYDFLLITSKSTRLLK